LAAVFLAVDFFGAAFLAAAFLGAAFLAAAFFGAAFFAAVGEAFAALDGGRRPTRAASSSTRA
jgi:hypothetical protein